MKMPKGKMMMEKKEMMMGMEVPGKTPVKKTKKKKK